MYRSERTEPAGHDGIRHRGVSPRGQRVKGSAALSNRSWTLETQHLRGLQRFSRRGSGSLCAKPFKPSIHAGLRGTPTLCPADICRQLPAALRQDCRQNNMPNQHTMQERAHANHIG